MPSRLPARSARDTIRPGRQTPLLPDPHRRRGLRRRPARPPNPAGLVAAATPQTDRLSGEVREPASASSVARTAAPFMRHVGLGDPLPHCDGAVAINDLLGEAVSP